MNVEQETSYKLNKCLHFMRSQSKNVSFLEGATPNSMYSTFWRRSFWLN